MKKILSIMIIAVFTLSFIVVFAANSDVTVKVDGNTVTFPDAKPFIDTKSNRTMVPIRFIAEEMGCTVGWSDQLRVVYINKGETNIELKIGNTKAILNGTIIDLDTEAIIKSDRTFVPLRFVSEALGADVKWDPSAKTVIITTKKAEPTPTPTPVPEQTAVTAKPTTYDPAKWVRVSENGEDAELAINIEWNDHDKFMSNCNYAESIIAKKYNTEIAKKVVDIARKKTDRSTQFSEQLNFNGKKIDIYVWGSSIGIYFWKAGVV